MSIVGIDLITEEIARLTAEKVGLQTDLSTNEGEVAALLVVAQDLTDQIAVIDAKILSLNEDIAKINV
jgi:peptidoglycan hydrolase CwlO-like protein